jgi:AAA domain
VSEYAQPDPDPDPTETVQPKPRPPGGKPDGKPNGKLAFNLTPYTWRDPASIPQRSFIGGRHLIRKFLSATISTGGVGKSTLVLADAVAMASGRKPHGANPNGQFKIWYWNGEDPKDEIERRVVAIMKHYSVSATDIGDRLCFTSGRDDGMEIIISRQTKNETTIAKPVEEALTEALIKGKFDVLMLDPFVATHRVSENDNMAIDAIAKTLGRIADRANCAIELVHHVRKTNGAEITHEEGRGASALVFAARSVRVLNPMSVEEAKKAKIEVEQKGFYFRSDIGKANLTPPSDKATWYTLKSVGIGNGGPIKFDADDFVEVDPDGGDAVGVVTSWDWPEPLEGVEASDLKAAQNEIAKGQWRPGDRTNDWVGIPIAIALKLDRNNAGDKHKIKGLIAIWTKTGALRVVAGQDKSRHSCEFVEVGEWA